MKKARHGHIYGKSNPIVIAQMVVFVFCFSAISAKVDDALDGYTSTHQQSIIDFLNSPFVIEKSEKNATKDLTNEGGDSAQQIDPIAAKKAREFLFPEEEELVQLFEYVRHSPVVRQNEVYSKALADVKFEYVENSEINAYASVEKKLCFTAGMARFSRMIALATASESFGDTGAAQRLISAMDRPEWWKLDNDVYLDILEEANLLTATMNPTILATSRNIAAGAILGVIGHEVGHFALGHIFSPGYDKTPDEVSRNREREADLFASSITASSPFGEYIVAGMIVHHAVLACREQGSEESTHPLSKERMVNAIIQNAALIRAAGVKTSIGTEAK